jgi:hypothetical protein
MFFRGYSLDQARICGRSRTRRLLREIEIKAGFVPTIRFPAMILIYFLCGWKMNRSFRCESAEDAALEEAKT